MILCTCGSRVGCAAHGPQPRDHAVHCLLCLCETWNHNAICDHCLDKDLEATG